VSRYPLSHRLSSAPIGGRTGAASPHRPRPTPRQSARRRRGPKRDPLRTARPGAAHGGRSRAATPPRHKRGAVRRRRAELRNEASPPAVTGRGYQIFNRRSGALCRVDVAEDPAALRDRLDELGPAARIAKLLAELGDEHVDDLWLRLVVGAAVQMLQ